VVRLERQQVRCNRDSQPLTPASGLSYTLVVRFLPQPQRASPPRQLELTPPGAAEFVICDHTIELFFRVLKQGCQIEQWRVQTEQRFLNALAMYMIVAWRIHNITMAGRAYPEASCEVVFEPQEWSTL
jgi:hypothetical protein